MKTLSFMVGVASVALPAAAQTIVAAPAPLLHVSTSFDLVVHASYAKTAPLFGPDGERAWAGKDWQKSIDDYLAAGKADPKP